MSGGKQQCKQKGVTIGSIIFNGSPLPSTEDIIMAKTGLTMIGRIDEEPYFDKNVILDYADRFREKLMELE